MPRSPLPRLVALLFALPGAFGAPVVAVAHGVAHHQEATTHHDAADHSAGAGRASAQPEPTAHHTAVVEGQDGGAGDHLHPKVGVAVSTRDTAPLSAVAPLRAPLPRASEGLGMPVQPEPTIVRKSNLSHDAPPRLRAPPATIG